MKSDWLYLPSAILAYLRARHAARLPDRNALEKLQTKRLAKWVRRDVPRVARYRHRPKTLDKVPIMDKAVLMADFAGFNRIGLDAKRGWDAVADDKQAGSYVVGASTGTSGNRGLFVISQAERFRWLGTILAKALPGFWRGNHRIAVLLPRNTPLYSAANRSSRMQLRFFDLADGPDIWGTGLAAFDPTVIVAPPKIFMWMAQMGLALSPRHIFTGAEKLEPQDRAAISSYFGLPVGEIYMGTEGLFAVTCAHGALHLCEDTMHFELPEMGDGLCEVIISNFSRQTQIMARYRMNDLIRLAAKPCTCGMPHRAIAEVVGRMDDCFYLKGENGASVMLTPDVIRNAVVDADLAITDYRVRQVGPDQVVLILPVGVEGTLARDALSALFGRRGVLATIELRHADLQPEIGRKLRRVENCYPQGRAI